MRHFIRDIILQSGLKNVFNDDEIKNHIMRNQAWIVEPSAPQSKLQPANTTA